jgi:hypothetical protein
MAHITVWGDHEAPLILTESRTKLDRRYKPPKPYEAVECEAIGQDVLVRLIRRHLDAMLRAWGLPPVEAVKEEEERQRADVQAMLDRGGGDE